MSAAEIEGGRRRRRKRRRSGGKMGRKKRRRKKRYQTSMIPQPGRERAGSRPAGPRAAVREPLILAGRDKVNRYGGRASPSYLREGRLPGERREADR
jgi:hypothetical protein